MFAFDTVQTSDHIIKQIVSKGANLLYDHYLNQKIPQHLNSKNQIYMQGITNGEIKLYDKEAGIKTDFQAKRILKDNYVAKALQIKKISMGSRKQANLQKPILLTKMKQKNKYLNNNTKSIIESGKNTHRLKESLLDTLIPLEQPKKYTKEQNQILKFDEQLRKAKNTEAIIARQQQRKHKQQSTNMKTQRLLLQKQYQNVRSRNLKYTYDFQGKILLCTPLNNNKQVYVKNVNPDIKVHIYDEKPQSSKLQSKKSVAHINKLLSDQLYSVESVNLVDKNSKTSRINRNVGTDPIKNQIFNNNNNRQISNINLIQLVQGAKLIQIETQKRIETQRKQTLTKRQFIQKNADSKFQSFFVSVNQKLNSQVFQSANNLNENNQNTNKKQNLRSTQLRTGTSFGTKNYTIREFKHIQDTQNKIQSRPQSGIVRIKSNNGTQRMIIENKNMVQMLMN